MSEAQPVAPFITVLVAMFVVFGVFVFATNQGWI